MRFRSIAIALALVLAATTAHAQDTALDRVQNLINTGRLTDARNTLAQWERTHGDPTSNASTADRARALYLTGVLSTDPAAAEDAFLNVVLSYPSSAVAPEALLRLGQGLYTAGETQRAITWLQRLQSDYPPSTARETGALWLARAQLAHGAAADACGTARESLAATTNPNLRTLIEIERDRACAESGGAATHAVVAATPAAAATAAAPATSTAAAAPPPTATVPAATTSMPALPDLGIAVDANVQDNEPARPATPRTTAAPASDTRGVSSATNGTHMESSAAARTDVGEFAVQSAAFSQRQAAERIAAEMKSKGFDVRIVTVPGSPLFRVRHGAFATSRDAAAAALRVRDAGFATFIVNDVRLERHQ
jgi:hypothetical protein